MRPRRNLTANDRWRRRAADGLRWQNSSLSTPCWREPDSNLRSPLGRIGASNLAWIAFGRLPRDKLAASSILSSGIWRGSSFLKPPRNLGVGTKTVMPRRSAGQRRWPRHRREAATPAGSPSAGSRSACGVLSGRGQSTRWSSRAIGPTISKASPGLSPTAAVMIHKPQGGRLSMARCPPRCAGRGQLALGMVDELWTDAETVGMGIASYCVMTADIGPKSSPTSPARDRAAEETCGQNTR
jgi:hypothetical protein